MQQATKELITPAAYARLRGLNRSTVSRQIRDGVIPTTGGMIGPEAADRARDSNLNQKRRKAEATPVAATAVPAEFNRGARWMAQQLCGSSRTAWPEFIAGLDMTSIPEPQQRVATRALFTGLMVHLLERWAAGYIDPSALPPIDWKPFGKDAAAIQREYKTLLAEWSAR